MDTRQVLDDLAKSAARFGVEFLADIELTDFNVTAFGEPQVTGLVGVQRREDPPHPSYVHLLAKQCVFALGSGFDNKLLRDKLGLRLSVRTSRSVMGVIHPPLIRHNFVRMDYYPKNHFNHVLRALQTTGTEKAFEYSMIANSAFDTEKDTVSEIGKSIEGLLATAGYLLSSLSFPSWSKWAS